MNLDRVHDHMCMVEIPGYLMLCFGDGEHKFWVGLGTSRNEMDRHETVSGRILQQFSIDARQHNHALRPLLTFHPDSNSDETGLCSVKSVKSEELACATKDSIVQASCENKVSCLLRSACVDLRSCFAGKKGFIGLC